MTQQLTQLHTDIISAQVVLETLFNHYQAFYQNSTSPFIEKDFENAIKTFEILREREGKFADHQTLPHHHQIDGGA